MRRPLLSKSSTRIRVSNPDVSRRSRFERRFASCARPDTQYNGSLCFTPSPGIVGRISNPYCPVAGVPLGPTPATGQYGFEMRPTIPGEGVKQSDPLYWVSGLAHDANRRSNLLLLETSGFDTRILVELFDKSGLRILKNGVPVSLDRTIPANSTVQLFDDADLFDLAPLPNSYAYAQITWEDNSAADPVGGTKGSVVGMATVIDNRTQDSSLHVGVTKSGLQPLPSL